jgi:hypothetical protein
VEVRLSLNPSTLSSWNPTKIVFVSERTNKRHHHHHGAPAPTLLQKEVSVADASPFLLTNPDFSKMEVVKATMASARVNHILRVTKPNTKRDTIICPNSLSQIGAWGLRINCQKTYDHTIVAPAIDYWIKTIYIKKGDEVDRLKTARIFNPLHAVVNKISVADIDNLKLFKLCEHPQIGPHCTWRRWEARGRVRLLCWDLLLALPAEASKPSARQYREHHIVAFEPMLHQTRHSACTSRRHATDAALRHLGDQRGWQVGRQRRARRAAE